MPRAQPAHGRNVIVVKACVQFTVIRHSRIDDLNAARNDKGVHDALHHLYLLCRAEVSGIQGVKGDPLPHPMVEDGRNIIRQVAIGVALEVTRRVRGEHGRGQNGRFHAAGRQDGKCHRQRALAHAGNVLHDEDSFIIVSGHDAPPYKFL